MLLAAAAGYEGEAAVATIAHIMRQQRLSPYDATLAARYQHSALQVSPPLTAKYCDPSQGSAMTSSASVTISQGCSGRLQAAAGKSCGRSAEGAVRCSLAQSTVSQSCHQHA